MASPQLENGYTSIANELMDALCQKSPGGANAQVFLAVIRKTYGWQKKQDTVSIEQFIEMTRLSRRSVIYALQNLEAMRMITVERSQGGVNNLAVQKDYTQWLPDARGDNYSKQQKRKKSLYQPVQLNKQPIIAPVQQIDATSATKTPLPVQLNDENIPIVAPTKERKKQKKEQKKDSKTYGEFLNVLLTDVEYQKLQDRFNSHRDEKIEALSCYKKSTGRVYKDDYATICGWARKDEKDGKNGTNRQNTNSSKRGQVITDPAQFTRPEDY